MAVLVDLLNNPCETCDKEFETEDEMNEHIKSKHTPKSVNHRCESCNFEFVSVQHLHDHVAISHSTIENEESQKDTRIIDIDDDAPSSPNFLCEKCDYSTTRGDILKTHVDFEHAITDPDNQTMVEESENCESEEAAIICGECGKLSANYQLKCSKIDYDTEIHGF